MERKVTSLEQKNKGLEKKIEQLETDVAISVNVTSQLAKEVDRLSQYTQHSNVIVRNVFLPEEETNEQVSIKMMKMIKVDMKLLDVVDKVDKHHRVGRIKQLNGKKTQDIIIKGKVNFVFADAHGDLKIRLNEPQRFACIPLLLVGRTY